MLRVILNKSWRQHPTKQQLYGHLIPITKTIQVRRTRHAGHCWRSKEGLISDVLLWTLSHRRAKAWQPARTYIQQVCADTGCSFEDLLGAMDGWQERVREIRAVSTTWWFYFYFPNFLCSIFFFFHLFFFSILIDSLFLLSVFKKYSFLFPRSFICSFFLSFIFIPTFFPCFS